MSSSVVKLSLVTEDFLGIGRGLVGFTGSTLSPALMLVMGQKPYRMSLWQYRTFSPRNPIVDRVVYGALPYTHSIIIISMDRQGSD